MSTNAPNQPLFNSLFAEAKIEPPVQLTATELRDSGIDSALQHVLKVKKEYVDRCLDEITKMERGLLFTSEALRDLAGAPPQGCENSIAGILKKAKAEGLIRNTNNWQIAKRVTIHAKPLSIWQRD